VSGCVPPEEYIKLMGEVGFDGAKCVGKGVFWTSPTTRSMDFVAIKAGKPSTAWPRFVKQALVFGAAVLFAVVVSKALGGRK